MQSDAHASRPLPLKEATTVDTLVEDVIHPNSIRLDAKSQKLHHLMNQIWELADTNLVVVSGTESDYSQNLEFADRLENFATLLHGLAGHCQEKAVVIRQRIATIQHDIHTNTQCETNSEADNPQKEISCVETTTDFGPSTSANERASSSTDAKFMNVKENNNSPAKFKVKCATCAQIFRNNFELRNHEGQHNNDKYKCLTCNTVFRSMRSFENHHNSHHSNYMCTHPGCGLSFKLKSTLSNHMQKHSGNKFSCKVPNCHPKFTYRQGYLEHIKWRHRDKPEAKCPVCQKLFWTPTIMRGHKLRSHTKVR